MFGKRYSVGVVVVAAALWLGGPSSGAAKADDEGEKKCEQDRLTAALSERISGDLDSLASELSVLVSQGETRRSIVEQITAAKNRSVGLHQVLSEFGAGREDQKQQGDGQQRDDQQQEGGGQQREDQKQSSLLETVRRIESAMANADVPTPRLDIKIPVAAHAKAITDASRVYVAVVPLVDEDQVRTITAFSNGEPVDLDPNTPPEVPTLVLVGAEPQADDPGYPLPEAKEPGKEENPRKVDDYVGIPWMYIFDDHESWLCGDPEIYVRVKRFRFSTFSIINQKINLPGVNGEQVWYNLGDPNSTYKFVNTSDYAPVVRIEVWEEDSGFHGGDDFLGALNVNWTRLGFAGYQYFTAGDARFGVDRD